MEPRLRIGTVFQSLHIGGDESRTLSFAQHHDRDRFALSVFSLTTPDGEHDRRHGPVAQRYRDLGVDCVFLGERPRGESRRLPGPLAVARDALRYRGIAQRLGRTLRQHRIDVIDAKMTYAILLCAAARRRSGARALIATEYFCGDWWGRLPQRALARWAFRRTDALVSDSNAALDDLRRHVRTVLPPTAVIQNGIPEPKPTCSAAEARRRLGVPDGVTVVGMVGKLVPFKGQDVLIEAMAGLLARQPTVHLLCCGYAGRHQDYVEALRRRVGELGIAPRVTLAGYPGPIGDVWPVIDVHVHGSKMDSSPIAIHESMACGLPAVVTRVGGVPELATDGETCLMVPPGDVRALADAIERLLVDRELRRRLGERARQRYLQRHRPQRMVAELQDLMLARYSDGATAAR